MKFDRNPITSETFRPSRGGGEGTLSGRGWRIDILSPLLITGKINLYSFQEHSSIIIPELTIIFKFLDKSRYSEGKGS